MTQGHLFDAPPTTLCGYCGRALTPNPSVPGAFACPRCRPILDHLRPDPRYSDPFDGTVAAFKAFQREAHRDRVCP